MELPAQIGKYEVVGLIGRGGMGVVYKARDNTLGRPVALKVMTGDLAADTETRVRFVREARSVSMLQHANIVVVYELGEHDSSPYIAMEFLEGEPLDHLIRSGLPFSLLEKIDVTLQVAKALEYAHNRGVIHRDIKPSNIMRMHDSTVKVVDFGIAHLTDQTITRTGMVLGTPAYLAPEQLNGLGIDRRTDIFSLGVVLYQLLTGKLPFEGTNTAETIMKILLEPPPRLPHQGDVNPPDLQQIVDQALAKKKEERFQSCSEMAEVLARLRNNLAAQMALEQLQRQDATATALAYQPQEPTAGALPTGVAACRPPIQTTGVAWNKPLQQIGQATVSQIPVCEESHPSVKVGGTRLKWALACLAIVVGAASLYSWLTRNSASSSLPVMTSGGSSSATSRVDDTQVTLSPNTAHILSGNRLDFFAAVSGKNDMELIWSVKEGDRGGKVVVRDERGSGRQNSFRAVYIAPNAPGKYHVVVSTKAEPHKSAIAEVTVTTRSLSPSTTPVKQQPQSESPYQ
jgi:serine/threonine protein kinase